MDKNIRQLKNMLGSNMDGHLDLHECIVLRDAIALLEKPSVRIIDAARALGYGIQMDGDELNVFDSSNRSDSAEVQNMMAKAGFPDFAFFGIAYNRYGAHIPSVVYKV